MWGKINMIKQIKSSEIENYIKENSNVVLLDVRTENEWTSLGKPNAEDLNSKTRKEKKLNETETFFLINCLFEFIEQRKDNKVRCGLNNSFLVKNIYEELFKRAINPIYIIIFISYSLT